MEDILVSVKYLLPCTCGKNVVIESRQAGESVACECGASLLVPTVRQMAALEVAEETAANAARTAKSWGGRERLVLLGVIILFFALCVTLVAVFRLRPMSRFDMIGAEGIQKSLQDLSPWRTWVTWERLQEGIDPRPDPIYVSQLRNYHAGLGVAVALALVGLGFLIGGKVASQQKRSVPSRRGGPAAMAKT